MAPKAPCLPVGGFFIPFFLAFSFPEPLPWACTGTTGPGTTQKHPDSMISPSHAAARKAPCHPAGFPCQGTHPTPTQTIDRIQCRQHYQVGPAKSNPVRFQPNLRPVSTHGTSLCQQTAIAQAPESGPQKGPAGPDAVPHASASAGYSPQRTAPYAAHHLQRL